MRSGKDGKRHASANPGAVLQARLQAIQQRRLNRDPEEAAIMIQSTWRMKQARAKVARLKQIQEAELQAAAERQVSTHVHVYTWAMRCCNACAQAKCSLKQWPRAGREPVNAPEATLARKISSGLTSHTDCAGCMAPCLTLCLV